MGTFAELHRRLDADDRIRGTQFEHICKWFLTNDPVYRQELSHVWLWDEWPGRWGPEAGIDLVAEDGTGGLWAIQAKAYAPTYRVTKHDVDTFLSESGRAIFTYRMLIATTNLIHHIGERTIQSQEKRVTFLRLNDLLAANVDWPTSPKALRPARPRKPARPHKYQREAISHVVKGFENADRGQLIMACGTGKTLTSLFIAEELQSKRTLVLLPSLSLLKQTLNAWKANSTNRFASLPVCSDETVATPAEDDTALAHTSDLGLPATTDPKRITAFLRKRLGRRTVFATYQSSPQIAKALELGGIPRFDLIIADEAHRCAGPVSSDFATVLDPSKITSKRRLFMTATPRVYAASTKRVAKDEDFEIASMDDIATFGPVFHRLTFGQAIKRKMLTDYQVAIICVDDATYREWAQRGAFVTLDGKQVTDAASLAGQIGLAKAMRVYNLRRVISFHSRVERARQFAVDLPKVIAWMPPRQRPNGVLWSGFASGQMPAGDRYVLLQQLRDLADADRGLLANARCLAEGVDVPTLNGVAFVDPRRSEVDIVQAVGRAIRKSEDKTVGTVVIPVFVDADTEPEIALQSSAFKPVWNVIKALRAHDDELGEQLDELRRAIGRKGARPRLPDKIHVDIPARVGADFARAFDVRLVEQSTAPWEFWFGLLQQYLGEHNDVLVPAKGLYKGHKLGAWVNEQRTLYQEGSLAPQRLERLNQLGVWAWDARAAAWADALGHLKTYVRDNGDALVRADYLDDTGFPLGQWVSVRRTEYAKGTLDEQRKNQLSALKGWAWSVSDANWEKGFQHLSRYCDIYRNTNVLQRERFEGYEPSRV